MTESTFADSYGPWALIAGALVWRRLQETSSHAPDRIAR